ncbi:Endoplasmic reticulum zinc transporter [Pestalotiopsis sp. 9143b]|nr:Endoplasmic reticulum zinc transporter [Pestalotiopsis sp. 9143b]
MAPDGHRPPPIPIPDVSPSIELLPSSPERPDDSPGTGFRSGHKSNTSAPLLHVPDGPSGHDNASQRHQDLFYDPNRLSPVAPTFQHSPGLLSPNVSPDMAYNGSAGLGASFGKENTPPIEIPTAAPNPFNFQTQVISTSPVKPNVGQRRGHRYKHSSISTQHQIFLEPPPRAPLALPRDLPIPTFKEAWKSMSVDQRRRLYWCCCHLLVACTIFLSAHNSLAMTALSHLVFFDVGSALIGVSVDVLGNFEVWKRSSIRHPFGLERAEVLAGFATSVFLVFGGFDLVSHNLKHVLEGLGEHESHHPDPHNHGPRVQPGHLDITSLVAIAATLVSAYGLKNHGRISRIMRTSYLASLPSILSNPFHFLTLSTAFLLLLLPLLHIPIYTWLDSSVCGLVAISMFGLGTRLATAQGLMLLMSYGGRTSASGKHIDIGVADVVSEIETEPSVSRVEEAQFWQVHYGVCMANLKVCVPKRCDDGALSKLRTRISNLVQNRLGEGYGKGNSLRWEVSLQTRTDK